MKQINEIDLNSYRDRVYQNAVNHGWHEEEKSIEHWLCMVISELMEAVEADRKGKYADVDTFKYILMDDLRERHLYGEDIEKSFVENFIEYIKDSVEDELADACIRLFDMAGVYNADFNFLTPTEYETSRYSKLTFTESVYKMIENFYLFKFNIIGHLDEIFTFCRSRGIDIFWFIDQKMKYNESRPFKHGGKKY